MGFSFAVFQSNKRKRMLVMQTLSALLWTAHFFLLGAFTGSAMNLITVGRNYVFFEVGKKRDVRIPLMIGAVFILAAILTWQGPSSLLPLTGSLIGTLAFWQIKPHYIRLIAIPGPCCWFAYNVLSRSYAGMMTDSLVLLSVLLGIYRFDILPVIRSSAKKKLGKQPKVA